MNFRVHLTNSQAVIDGSDDDLFEVIEGGALMVNVDGKRTTYAPHAWDRAERD